MDGHYEMCNKSECGAVMRERYERRDVRAQSVLGIQCHERERGWWKNTEYDRHNMALFILVRVFRCMLMRSNDMFEMALTITFYLIWFFCCCCYFVFKDIEHIPKMSFELCFYGFYVFKLVLFYFTSKYEMYICFRLKTKDNGFFCVCRMGLDISGPSNDFLHKKIYKVRARLIKH